MDLHEGAGNRRRISPGSRERHGRPPAGDSPRPPWTPSGIETSVGAREPSRRARDRMQCTGPRPVGSLCLRAAGRPARPAAPGTTESACAVAPWYRHRGLDRGPARLGHLRVRRHSAGLPGRPVRRPVVRGDPGPVDRPPEQAAVRAAGSVDPWLKDHTLPSDGVAASSRRPRDRAPRPATIRQWPQAPGFSTAPHRCSAVHTEPSTKPLLTTWSSALGKRDVAGRPSVSSRRSPPPSRKKAAAALCDRTGRRTASCTAWLVAAAADLANAWAAGLHHRQPPRLPGPISRAPTKALRKLSADLRAWGARRWPVRGSSTESQPPSFRTYCRDSSMTAATLRAPRAAIARAQTPVPPGFGRARQRVTGPISRASAGRRRAGAGGCSAMLDVDQRSRPGYGGFQGAS